jgi:hypothetical protein
MNMFEVNSENLYRGQTICPFPLDGSVDDYPERRQWFFEKAYFESPFNRNVPLRLRFFNGKGLLQYQYFKGEEVCPVIFASGGGHWWSMERDHWERIPYPPYVFPFAFSSVIVLQTKPRQILE